VTKRVRLDDFNDIPDMTIGYDIPASFNGKGTYTWINLASGEYATPPEPPCIKGILYAGRRHVISGPPESTKTLVAYMLLLEALRTGEGVAILDFEMGPHAAATLLRELGATQDELCTIHYAEPQMAPSKHDLERIIGLGVGYCLLDAAAGAYDVTGLDDNARKDAETFAAKWIRPLWQAGTATIVIDHVVKNADNRGKYAIGSERKTGQADVHLSLEALKPLHRGSTGLVKIHVHKDRPGHLQRPTAFIVELASSPDDHHISWEFKKVEHNEGAFRPTVLMHRVSEWLQTQDEPATFTKIKDSVTGEDAYIAIAIQHLIDEGYATEIAGARNARLVSHTHLFTDQPAPLRPSNHAELTDENSVTSVKTTDLTPADPCVTPAPQDSTTPAAASIAAGDEGVTNSTTPADYIDVYDPEVQARLDGPDIPF
jgi:hypothetical protein